MSEEERKPGEIPQPVPGEEELNETPAPEETLPAEAPAEDAAEEAAETPADESAAEAPEEAPAEEWEEAPEGPEEEPEAAPVRTAEAADDMEDDAPEEDDKKRKVIIGVSIVAAIVVIFIVVLVCLLGSCTHRHTMSYVEEVASTCTTAGTAAHWHCDECGKNYADEAGAEELTDLALPLAAHTLTHNNEVASTCETAGTAEYWHCTVCEKDFADEACTEELHDLSLPLAAHTFVEDVYQAPTCTESGLSTGSHCSVCGEVFAEQEVIPALGHVIPEEGFTITEVPTCTVGGSGTYECARCHEVIPTPVEPLGHAETQLQGKEPTCEDEGYYGEVICTRCGETVRDRIVRPALNHDYVLSENNCDPTCIQAGLEGQMICTRCNKIDPDHPGTVIPALGHLKPEDASEIDRVDPTCTEDGSESYTCMRCHEHATDVLAALGHDPVLEGNYDATCTQAGLEGRTVCSRCDDVESEGTVIAPLGHTVSNNVCAVCNAPASTGFTFALNSDRQSYILVTIGTCTDTDIIIPDTYADEASGLGALPVTSIANMAFMNASSVVSVSIPYSVTSVGTMAFMNCTSLANVKFGAAVTSIGSGAFMGCENLTSVRFAGDAEGWSVSNVVGAAGTPVDSAQLSDPAQAAVLFKETYLQYDWTKSPATVG